MKKIRIVKYLCLVAMLLGCSLGSSVDKINAAEYQFTECGSDEDTTFGTKGKLSVSTTLDVDVPLIRGCSIRSKGSSNTSFKKNGVDCKRKFKKHTISAKIGGIGGGSISTSEAGLSSASSEEKFSCDTYDWNYTIYSDIFKLYSYHEVHTVSYEITKGKSKKTVTMSAKVKYC